MKQFKRQFSLLLFLFLMGLSLLFAWHEQQAVEGNVLVHVIDVGQADCMVLETPHGNVLVDSGADVSEGQLRAYLKSHGLNHFAYMILSHPHDDHIGNADMLLREFQVDRVLCAETSSAETVWTLFVTELDNLKTAGKTEWIKAETGTVCHLGALRIEVLFAPKPDNEGENNDSLLVRMDYGDCSMLLTGDAEANAEEMFLNEVSSEKLQADFLKVGHHGSSGSTTDAFLTVVSPKIATISAGTGNSFGHPHEEVLARLRERNVEIYRTDNSGTLVFVCDGTSFSRRKLF